MTSGSAFLLLSVTVSQANATQKSRPCQDGVKYESERVGEVSREELRRRQSWKEDWSRRCNEVTVPNLAWNQAWNPRNCIVTLYMCVAVTYLHHPRHESRPESVKVALFSLILQSDVWQCVIIHLQAVKSLDNVHGHYDVFANFNECCSKS